MAVNRVFCVFRCYLGFLINFHGQKSKGNQNGKWSREGEGEGGFNVAKGRREESVKKIFSP